MNSMQHQEKYEDQSKKKFKKLQVASEAVPIGQLSGEFKQSFKNVSHINFKRIQAKVFQDDH